MHEGLGMNHNDNNYSDDSFDDSEEFYQLAVKFYNGNTPVPDQQITVKDYL